MEEGPEPQEWVERAAEEHHHGHGHGDAHEVGMKLANHTASAITAAVLAVLAAIGSLLSGHAANQAILMQTRASDQWSYYQAKSTKGHLYEVAGELVTALSPAQGGAAAPAREHFRQQSQRYDKEKEELQGEAKALEQESQHEFQKHQKFALGVAIFQVGIVLASVSILVKFKPLYVLSVVAGVVGLVCVGLGFTS
jgi:Domain of unknown function (DUF4337)